MKVYVLTRGTYSDYAVCCVAASQELAEEILASTDRWKPDEILELEVLTEVPATPPPMWQVILELDDAGTQVWYEEASIDRSAYEHSESYPRPRLRSWENVISRRPETLDRKLFRIEVLCDRLDLARKVAFDRAAQRRAGIQLLS